MSTPIFAFWVCHRQMDRLNAQEQLAQFHHHVLVNSNEDARQEWVDRQVETIGQVVKEKTSVQQVPAEQVREGINRLKQLAK